MREDCDGIIYTDQLRMDKAADNDDMETDINKWAVLESVSGFCTVQKYHQNVPSMGYFSKQNSSHCA